MPWIKRPGRKRSGGRLSRGLRRWRYDHSEGVISFCIGAGVALLAVFAALIALKFIA